MRYFKSIMLMGIVFVTSCLSSADGAETTIGSTAVTNNVLTGETVEGNIGDVTLKAGDTMAEITIKDYGTITFKLFPEIAPIGVENFTKLAESGYYKGKNIHRIISDFMIQGGSLNGNGVGGEAADGGDFAIETTTSMRHFYGALCYANAGASVGNTCQFYVVNSKASQDYSQYDLAAITNNADYFAETAASYGDSEGDQKAKNYYLYQQKYYENMGYFVRTATDKVREKYKKNGGAPLLDGNYTVFGQAVDGLDVLDKVSKVATESNGNAANEEISKPVTEIIISDVVVKPFN